MSSSCVIDGKRCTMCCRAITLKPIPDSNTGYDAEFVRKHWVKISEAEAREVNPWMFTTGRNLTGEGWEYYRCLMATDEGCAAYDKRPGVCSEYPRYGMDGERWNAFVPTKNSRGNMYLYVPDYHARCTEFPVVIPVVNL